MLLILTHEKSDFDAVASQLGAHKLFPAGLPLLPRHLNRNVQQFLNLYWDALPFMRAEDWRRKRVNEVILVDTQNLNSVRGMAKQPRVRVIDHHIDYRPREGWTYHVEAVGATTTILVEMLQTSGLTLTAEEATLLLLGIYEDSGALTYDTATSRDARAAAWLFDQGAKLDVVRRFLAIPLTVQQQALYDELQANAEWLRIQGRPVAIATAVAPERFSDEISSVAHRLRDTLTPDGLFVLVQLGHDVQLVARSSHEDVDVSLVARELGGGGHSRAAAALIIETDVAAVTRRIKKLLPQIVKPVGRVSEIMSLGVNTISPDTIVTEAARLMRRSGHEGYPVVDSNSARIKGLLTRNAVDRAMSHELGYMPVSRIMSAGAFTVRPSASIERVQELMLREGWGQIPVVAEESIPSEMDRRPIGIVTRTDLLTYWFKPVTEVDDSDMRVLLAESLSPPLWALVQAVSESAAELGMPLYFVGGLVRDLLLQKTAVDLDMVVEGNAIELVQQLQQQFGGEVHTHARFGTAKWFIEPDIWRAVVGRYGLKSRHLESASPISGFLPESIDFVTARSEFYTEPSALPEVERGSIKLDLHRRDFTINTLAIRLDGAHLGEMLDFYGGQRDLELGLIRVLHSLSFIDDPTRILRAVRLEQRLAFNIEPRTQELLADSLPMLSRVTGSRIRHEIEQGMREADPVKVLERLSDLDVLQHIQEGLRWTGEAAHYLYRLPLYITDPLWQEALPKDSLEFLYFALWLVPLPREVQQSTVKRLHARKATGEDVLAVGTLIQALRSLPEDALPSQIAQSCRPHRSRVLLTARIVFGDDPLGGLLDRYFSEWRFVKASLGGDELRELGLTPGPPFAFYLDRLLAARLDGLVEDEAGERALLAEMLRNKEEDAPN